MPTLIVPQWRKEEEMVRPIKDQRTLEWELDRCAMEVLELRNLVRFLSAHVPQEHQDKMLEVCQQTAVQKVGSFRG